MWSEQGCAYRYSATDIFHSFSSHPVLTRITGVKPYRRGMELLGEYLTARDMPVKDVSDLSIWLGPRWGYWLGAYIPRIAEYGGVPPGVVESEVLRLVKARDVED